MAEETEVTIDQAASTGTNQVSAIPAPQALPPTPAPAQAGPVHLRVPELTSAPAAEDETASIAAATTGARAGLATAAGQAQAGVEHLPTGQEIGPTAAAAPAPDVPAGPLPAATTPAPITPPAAPAMEQSASALMDEAYGSSLRQEGAAASAAAATLLGQHRQGVERELSQTTTSMAQSQQTTLGAQQAERTATAQAVTDRKTAWRAEQATATDDYTQQATAEQDAVSVEVTATMAAARQAAQAEVTAAARQGPPVQQALVQRSWWDRAKNAVSSGVSAIGRGARSVGAAASSVYDAARTRAGALLDTARNAVRTRVGAFLGAVRGALGKAVARISAATSAARTWIQSRVSAGINRLTALARSLSDRALALARRCRAAIGRFVSVLKSGIAKIGAKLGAVARRIWNAGKVLWQIAKVLKDGAVKAFVMLIEAPGQALEYIKGVVAGLVAKAPDKMQSVLAQYVAPRLGQAPAAGSGPTVVQRQQASTETRADPALETRWAALWRHLTVRYEYVKANWWQVIKDAALEVLVPGVALYRHVPTLVKELGAAFTAMLGGDYSVGFDHLLASARSLMAIVASFTAQVSIAAFIIGSIIGTPIVGVAALETIGITILVADASLQLLTLAHSLDNLDRRRTLEQHNNDYGLIADSSIALVLLGLLALLGAIASSAVNSLLRRFPALVTAAESLRTRIRSRLGRGAGASEAPTPKQLPPTPAEPAPATKTPTPAEPAPATKDGPARKPGEKDVDPAICFPRGTLVYTPEGRCPIERIAMGTLIFAYDFGTREVVTRRVLGLTRGSTTRWTKVQVGDDTVRATPNHLFWVECVGDWVMAGDLSPGMALRSDRGEIATVTHVASVACPNAEETFNLSVEHAENYFVGNIGALVHNITAERLARLRRPGFRNYVLRDASGTIYYSGMCRSDETPGGLMRRHGANNNRFSFAKGDRLVFIGGTREYGQARLMEHRNAIENGTIIGRDGDNYRGNRQNPINDARIAEYIEYEQFLKGCG